MPSPNLREGQIRKVPRVQKILMSTDGVGRAAAMAAAYWPFPRDPHPDLEHFRDGPQR